MLVNLVAGSNAKMCRDYVIGAAREDIVAGKQIGYGQIPNKGLISVVIS